MQRSWTMRRRRGMIHLTRSWSLIILVLFVPAITWAQYDGLAMAGPAPGHRALKEASIALMETDVPGVVRLELPVGTDRVELLNARGNVVRELGASNLPFLDLGTLKPGPWTLRVRAASGYQVQRFLVLADGHMFWSPPQTRAKRGH
mgnify:CR=1 FL=1